MGRRIMLSLCLIALAACSTEAGVRAVQYAKPSVPDTSPSVPDTRGGSEQPPAPSIKWERQDKNIDTATIDVPMDYSDPSKGHFTLFLARHRATDKANRIGSLLVNPGGPGFGGSDFALYADQVYGDDLLQRFDIIGWDPRGTGKSTPAVDCIGDTQYDHFFGEADITPDDAASKQALVDLAKEFAADCTSKNAAILPYIGTNNSARDMDAIRRALGEEKISYFGFSYGSELGATWATLFPHTVRAAVLDGASDPNADLITSGLQQSAGFENSLDTFLEQCSASAECAFYNGSNAGGAFDSLMARIDDHPLRANPGRPMLTRGAALQAVAQAMYDQSYWPQLEQALADAQSGDGTGLQDLYDDYYQRSPDGHYGNELEAFQSITCMDSADRPTVAEDDATVPEFQKVAPRLSPGTTGGYFCTFWPKSADPRVKITGKGAGPILVMGTTGDPATPLKSTENMAKALEDGRLVIVKGDQHTGYGINECSKSTVGDYLIDPVHQAPASGKRCD